MSRQLTLEDSRQALLDHVTDKGIALRNEFGPDLNWETLKVILQDRRFTRYPCEVVFGAGPLQPGEFAFPEPNGLSPEEGFTLHIHPSFLTRKDEVPAMVFYQLVAVNYGEFASSDDAEAFGAAALGITRETYYQMLCAWSDEVGGGPIDELLGGAGSCGCSSGSSCESSGACGCSPESSCGGGSCGCSSSLPPEPEFHACSCGGSGCCSN